MNKRKILALAMSLSIVAILAAGATLAYFMDTDYAANTMTLGGVYIEQNEYMKDKTAYDPNQALMPATGAITGYTDNADPFRSFTGLNGAVDKYVTVKNTSNTEMKLTDEQIATGNYNAYVRTIVAVEMGTADWDTFDQYVGLAYNETNSTLDEIKWAFAGKEMTLSDTNYYVMTFTYPEALKPGAETIPSLRQLYLTNDTTNEIIAKLDGNKSGKLEIHALSQGVQTANFADAATALNTAFGEVDATNLNKWLEDATVTP